MILPIGPLARPATRFIIAWNISITVLLALTAVMMRQSSPEETQRRARQEEPSNLAILLTTIITAAGGLGGIAYAQTGTYGLSHLQLSLHTLHSIVGVLLAWLLIHAIYSLHYAKLYYQEPADPGDGAFRKGLAFPGGRDVVDYWDFVYFSLVIGMTNQVSDVAITCRPIRHTVSAHAIVSFFFNVALLALMVNIAASAI